MTRKPRTSSTPDFEKSLEELEALVARLERGDLPLAEALALFEQGVALTRSCHARAGRGTAESVEILLQEGGAARARALRCEREPGDD